MGVPPLAPDSPSPRFEASDQRPGAAVRVDGQEVRARSVGHSHTALSCPLLQDEPSPVARTYLRPAKRSVSGSGASLWASARMKYSLPMIMGAT